MSYIIPSNQLTMLVKVDMAIGMEAKTWFTIQAYLDQVHATDYYPNQARIKMGQTMPIFQDGDGGGVWGDTYFDPQ